MDVLSTRKPLKFPLHQAVYLTVLQKSLLLSHQARTALALETGHALHVGSQTSSAERHVSVALSPLWVLAQVATLWEDTVAVVTDMDRRRWWLPNNIWVITVAVWVAMVVAEWVVEAAASFHSVLVTGNVVRKAAATTILQRMSAVYDVEPAGQAQQLLQIQAIPLLWKLRRPMAVWGLVLWRALLDQGRLHSLLEDLDLLGDMVDSTSAVLQAPMLSHLASVDLPELIQL
jgi:hypothetical protein